MAESNALGVVRSINVSNGGVPKLSRQTVAVRATGLDGDRQRDLRSHGGPDRAVCLYSLELIDALRAEGHPITAGAIGENLTIAGVPWAGMTPGVRLDIGDVSLELTSYANPCRNIAGSFLQGQMLRVSETRHPGWSRVYARVLREGVITVGDTVMIGPGVERVSS
jgi:MOSC domain-containing protein YiiM